MIVEKKSMQFISRKRHVYNYSIIIIRVRHFFFSNLATNANQRPLAALIFDKSSAFTIIRFDDQTLNWLICDNPNVTNCSSANLF